MTQGLNTKPFKVWCRLTLYCCPALHLIKSCPHCIVDCLWGLNSIYMYHIQDVHVVFSAAKVTNFTLALSFEAGNKWDHGQGFATGIYVLPWDLGTGSRYLLEKIPRQASDSCSSDKF